MSHNPTCLHWGIIYLATRSLWLSVWITPCPLHLGRCVWPILSHSHPALLSIHGPSVCVCMSLKVHYISDDLSWLPGWELWFLTHTCCAHGSSRDDAFLVIDVPSLPKLDFSTQSFQMDLRQGRGGGGWGQGTMSCSTFVTRIDPLKKQSKKVMFLLVCLCVPSDDRFACVLTFVDSWYHNFNC